MLDLIHDLIRDLIHDLIHVLIHDLIQDLIYEGSSRVFLFQTLYNDAGRTADRIVIPMVLLYIESRVGLISRKKEANA